MAENIINHLQHRVDDLKTKLHALTEHIQRTLGERETLSADLAGYERALSAEMRNQGHVALPKLSQESLPLTEDAATNKAEFARQFVRGHGNAGVTPDDIFKGFQDAGIPIAKPYVYALVQRLQKQSAIRKRRGRWIPVLESDPTPESENAIVN